MLADTQQQVVVMQRASLAGKGQVRKACQAGLDTWPDSQLARTQEDQKGLTAASLVAHDRAAKR